MKICKELLYQELGRLLVRNFNELQFDYQQVIMTKSVQALNRIQEILQVKLRVLNKLFYGLLKEINKE